MAETVAVLGGGVGGLTAAHELSERGFAVRVFEAGERFGGKARSLPVPATGQDGRPDLPGEHGFRFFPGFYRHLPDTMRRIPYRDQADGVLGNLIEAPLMQVARTNDADPIVLAGWPDNLRDGLVGAFGVMTARWGIPPWELAFFMKKLWIFATSCEERRNEQWEHVPWWDFVAASTKSSAYQTLLARGLTRSLVAMRAEEGSTRTVGRIIMQLILDMLRIDGKLDRLLVGPTNEVWLEPWTSYLTARGVGLATGHKLSAISVKDGRVDHVIVRNGATETVVRADHYVLAIPVEQLVPLLSAEILALAPELSRLGELKLGWMNGIQFYFRKDVPLARGHTIYPDTPWALTSVSQEQFWRRSLREYGDGTVSGCLSVDVSDWETPGPLYGKPAKQLSRRQIHDEVWVQLKRALNDESDLLADSNVVTWFLDPDIVAPNPSSVTNLEPLLVNTAGSLAARPNAITSIGNLFLASDFVRTFTDLATMEAANEAARRATNGILQRSGGAHPPALLFPLTEPSFLDLWKRLDARRWARGKPHLLG